MSEIKSNPRLYAMSQLRVVIQKINRQLREEGCLAGQYSSYDLSSICVAGSYGCCHLPGLVISAGLILGIACHQYVTRNLLLHREVNLLTNLLKEINPSTVHSYQNPAICAILHFSFMNFLDPRSEADLVIRDINTLLQNPDIIQSRRSLLQVVSDLENAHSLNREPLRYVRAYNPEPAGLNYVLK